MVDSAALDCVSPFKVPRGGHNVSSNISVSSQHRSMCNVHIRATSKMPKFTCNRQ